MLQIPRHLVAAKMPDHQAPSEDDDCLHLDIRNRRHHALGLLLRSCRGLRGQPQRKTLPRRLAEPLERSTLLCRRKSHLLLHSSNDPYYIVLHTNLDQSMAPSNPHRHPRCPNGAHATEIKSQSSKNACSRGHSVCPIMVPSLPHLRKDKVRRSHPEMGRRHVPGGHSSSSMAGIVELLHQSHSVCVL